MKNDIKTYIVTALAMAALSVPPVVLSEWMGASGKGYSAVLSSKQDIEKPVSYTHLDGGTYGKLDFDRFMVQFISDRFAEFEVVSETEEGLKIPATSVTTKDFFTVPVEFAASGGDESGAETGFYKEVYSESGEASVVFTPAEIYGATDEYYYVETSEDGAFKNGDYIVKQDSSERYQIGATAPLEGVYNIDVYKRQI